MFLFKPFHIPDIEDGTKTQTRRFHKQWRAKVGSIHQVRTTFFGKPHCHIKILRRWEERVGDISAEDAKAEGGYKPEEYIEGLLEMHGGKYTRDSIPRCYEFEKVDVRICPICERNKLDDLATFCLDCIEKKGTIIAKLIRAEGSDNDES